VLIRTARVPGRGVADVRLAGGRIAEIAPWLIREPGEEELHGGGRWLLPGLHDHHLHLRALAASAGSVPLGPPRVRDTAGLAARLAEADRKLPPGAWLRGTGYHESVAGTLDRQALDRLLPGRPVRVQHRSGALWMLNSRAAELAGLSDRAEPGIERDEAGPTGRLWRMDSWLAGRVGTARLDLAAVSAAAARLGVTGFTDATPDMTDAAVAGLAEAVASGDIRQRVHCMAPPEVALAPTGRFSLGPVKILLDDTALPALAELADRIAAAHAAGRPAAVHCVTRVQLALTQAAFDTAGVVGGDRIEHGAVIGTGSLRWLRERGVIVVTQPGFPVERAEQYAREVPAEDRPDLWRLRSLLAAGVRVAAGTDAPFGNPDPWRALRACLRRPPGETTGLARALRLFQGTAADPARPRRVTQGAVADLILLGDPVAATIINGQVIFTRPC
jgi:predicted amidohydrolase YtcJ